MRRLLAAAGLALLVACSPTGNGHPSDGPAALPPSGTAAAGPGSLPRGGQTSPAVPSATVPPASVPWAVATPAAGCPSSYRLPDPRRPVLRLAFDLRADGGTVTGHEQLTFTPERDVSEVVLRLWPSSPVAAAHGGHLAVTAWSTGGRSGAGSPPRTQVETLVRLPLAAPSREVRAEVDFTLTLPVGANERWGHRGPTSWWATGFPLLAYEDGHGYDEEPPTALFAEAAVSETFRLADLAVTAPAAAAVLASGTAGQVETHPGGVSTRHFAADAVRDVAVAVGPFRTVALAGTAGTAGTAGMPGGAPAVTVGVAPGLPDDPAVVARAEQVAAGALAARFGPFPFPQLTVAVLPDLGGGVEMPGLVLLGTRQLDATATHEVAHQWFYGLVGDDQARDPWLDEAFATYAEALVRGTGPTYRQAVVPSVGRGRVGAPMTYWAAHPEAYFAAVYRQGAAALLDARDAAGPAAFDTALRCYVAAHAWTVTTPADLAAALGQLPAALGVLRRAGALAG